MRQLTRLSVALWTLLVSAACSSLGMDTFRPTAPATAPTRFLPTPFAPTSLSQPTLVSGQRYLINKQAHSNEAVLADIVLEIRSAEIQADSLLLRIAFVNTGERSFSLVGGQGTNGIILTDASGGEHNPTAVDPQLATIDPPDGFQPGTANVGNLLFPLPLGAQPYTLRFPPFDSIQFQLDTLADQPNITPAIGRFTLDAVLRSQTEALRPIALQLQTIEFTEQEVIFSVAFVNTGRQGYDLTVGPNGSDARLVDGEGIQHTPRLVDAAFEHSIAPPYGWKAGEANQGMVHFPRPAVIDTLRFMFPAFDALSMTLDAQGIASAKVTSPAGNAPAPTAIPTAEELVFGGIERTLTAQTEAIQQSDREGFLETLDPALRDARAAMFNRLSQLPIISYTLQLAPDAHVQPDSATQVVSVTASYRLHGIDQQNVFVHDLQYRLQRDGEHWLVTEINALGTPPFWWNGEVVTYESAHFLIIARPASVNDLPALAAEAEQAYQALAQKQLALETRYVAYVSDTQEDFTALTGRGKNYLGVALSRYSFGGNAIVTTSRAFYINGARFANQPDSRLTTITHELAHLALADQTRPFTPPWLVEGMAVYLSEDTGPAARQDLRQGGSLDSLSLTNLTPAGSLDEREQENSNLIDEYAFSGAAVAYLVERYGEQRVLEFYHSYATVPADEVTRRIAQSGQPAQTNVIATLSVEHTQAAVPEFFSISLEQLDQDVKAWIAAQ